MSLNDIKIVKPGGLTALPTQRYTVQAGAITINAGEPVKGGTAPYVVPSADAEPVTGTPTFIGIAASTSTQTASADGYVDVYIPLPGVIYRASAKSAAAVDTQAEIDALKQKRVVLDLTSSVYTVDTAASDASTNGIIIVDGDPVAKTVDFTIKQSVLFRN